MLHQPGQSSSLMLVIQHQAVLFRKSCCVVKSIQKFFRWRSSSLKIAIFDFLEYSRKDKIIFLSMKQQVIRFSRSQPANLTLTISRVKVTLESHSWKALVKTTRENHSWKALVKVTRETVRVRFAGWLLINLPVKTLPLWLGIHSWVSLAAA